MRHSVLLATCVTLAACARTSVLLVPDTPVNPPTTAGYLRAGFGSSDITPDISASRLALAGYGPD